MFGKKFICGHCGEKVDAIKESKGSALEFMACLCFFVIPGLIYLIWMFSGRKLVCPKCKSYEVVRIDCPKGHKLMKEFGHT